MLLNHDLKHRNTHTEQLPAKTGIPANHEETKEEVKERGTNE